MPKVKNSKGAKNVVWLELAFQINDLVIRCGRYMGKLEIGWKAVSSSESRELGLRREG